MAERHDLPKKQVINEYAKMIVGDERILNKKTTDARVAIVDWLKSENLLIEEKEITHNIATAERTGGIVEPLPKLQWFVAVNKEFTLKHSEIKGIESNSKTTLKEIMKKAVENGQVSLLPEHFIKTYFHWIDKLNDWCISRQIWYGHRIPVWYKGDELYVGIEPPEGEDWTQDEDTLDTWFSSGLWTFSTLGWPEKTKDLEIYHPTNTLVTAYEIIFFWVARMIFMTGYALGTIPFSTVYFTGIVRDNQGRKFSKSLGNGIDPMDISKKFSTDAGRFTLIMSSGPGTDSKLAEDKIRGYKNFGNKIWNITRFVLENTKDFKPESVKGFDKNAPEFSWQHKNLEDLNTVLTKITDDIENYRFYLAGEKLYAYVWHTFADKIIEECKTHLKDGDENTKLATQFMLRNILTTILKALHPFMPFVTEEIWSMMSEKKNLLMVESWPARNTK
jgi:valyl-tRNA synthetase